MAGRSGAWEARRSDGIREDYVAGETWHSERQRRAARSRGAQGGVEDDDDGFRIGREREPMTLILYWNGILSIPKGLKTNIYKLHVIYDSKRSRTISLGKDALFPPTREEKGSNEHTMQPTRTARFVCAIMEFLVSRHQTEEHRWIICRVRWPTY